MTPELLLLILASAGLSGIGGTLWAQRARAAYVARVRTDWVRAGRTIRSGPVSAISYGTRPRMIPTGGLFGALGIIDRAVVFEGHRSNRHNVTIPLDAIRWIGLTTLQLGLGRAGARQRLLMIHFDSPDGWRAATFATEALEEIAGAVGHETGLPVRDTGSERPDYGPMRATRWTQDVYGEWSMDREGELYLAPDRLLFAWRSAIPLADIRRLDVLSEGGLQALNPLSTELLRVEYGTPEGETDVVGFKIRHADRWAEVIASRGTDELAVVQGRKKKAN